MMDRIQGANSLISESTSQKVSQAVSSQAPKDSNKNALQSPNNKVSEEKAFKELAKKLEAFKKVVKTSFRYEILKKPHMIVIKVVNDESGEVVRQIPPKEAVKLAKAIEALLGLFVDKHV